MYSRQDIVLIFTRYPTPGFSKTRLIPILGPQGAAGLQRKMTEQIVAQAARLIESHPHDLEIHYEGGSLPLMRAWLGPSRTYQPQKAGDLGTRMSQAISAHLKGKRAIILAGSDCPALTSSLLTRALEALQEKDIVIGPACDGGYYLIGVRGGVREDCVSSLFTDIPWGSASVFAETMARAGRLQLTSHILPELHDIDRPEDLRYLHYNSDLQ
ncbi:MAG: TIGR04282 family arsenosugar biosynthesis glycosyltransferase [Desulfocapsaceae bacterium]|nr:TIGR04282 family arsenosugar biosynthesis glycosyltransferase [Desulfosporosinus sp.]MDR3629554.1 TIGR04282 family arsenosugar biosynthesis glycosyltransferase [Desulfocapsaceae bacterium]